MAREDFNLDGVNVDKALANVDRDYLADTHLARERQGGGEIWERPEPNPKAEPDAREIAQAWYATRSGGDEEVAAALRDHLEYAAESYGTEALLRDARDMQAAFDRGVRMSIADEQFPWSIDLEDPEDAASFSQTQQALYMTFRDDPHGFEAWVNGTDVLDDEIREALIEGFTLNAEIDNAVSEDPRMGSPDVQAAALEIMRSMGLAATPEGRSTAYRLASEMKREAEKVEGMEHFDKAFYDALGAAQRDWAGNVIRDEDDAPAPDASAILRRVTEKMQADVPSAHRKAMFLDQWDKAIDELPGTSREKHELEAADEWSRVQAGAEDARKARDRERLDRS